ncbi:MAG: post-transcriptional regulator [Sporolactobacillus sp.]|nr:post-transcriptional regulator [Sporolactobacillus sp.]MCI1881203.1 post-transcriptional regulator [Sporolactobacillus sp.]
MPGDSDNLEKWREKIGPFLRSKLEEFRMLGLENLTMDEFWQFAKTTMEKKKEDKPERIHEVVSCVMSLTVNDYMNKLRMDMFRKQPIDVKNPLSR